jgi:hypothetical protein
MENNFSFNRYKDLHEKLEKLADEIDFVLAQVKEFVDEQVSSESIKLLSSYNTIMIKLAETWSHQTRIGRRILDIRNQILVDNSMYE